jgi:3-dehydroquinate dehydratase/shikimate dehydrogenase
VTRGVVHSILEATPEAVARRLEGAPSACAMIEVRADGLRAGDVAGLVRRASRSVVVTVRAREDGGAFDGSAEEKRSILDAALAAGAAFVDVEWDGPLRAFALGASAPRTILSHHGAPCEEGALGPLFRAMAGTRARALKIVPSATRGSELGAIRALLRLAREERRALCAFASGDAVAWSRIVALSWGSWGVYGAAARGRETGDGQLLTRDLLEVYRVLELGEPTRWFGLCGSPLSRSPSPALHAAGYRALGLDAVYVPIDAGTIEEAAAIVGSEGPLPLEGFGVTIPLKVEAARRCASLDEHAACGAVNTVRAVAGRWEGFNTDAPAALALIREHLEPAGAEVAIVGAGGTARAIAAVLKTAGARVTLYARNDARGGDAAAAVGVAGAPLRSLPGSRWDLLVQATPAGARGEEVLLRRHLDGRMVLDAAYGDEPTPLVRAARARGLVVVDGPTLLAAQAAIQFETLTGQPAPREAMAAVLPSRGSTPSY